MRLFRVVRGYGDTETSSAVSGVEGVAAHIFVKAGSAAGFERYWDGSDPVLTSGLETKMNSSWNTTHQLILENAYQNYKACYKDGPERRRTARDPPSSFSTGQFVHETEFHRTGPEDNMASELTRELAETLEVLANSWADMACEDARNVEILLGDFHRKWDLRLEESEYIGTDHGEGEQDTGADGDVGEDGANQRATTPSFNLNQLGGQNSPGADDEAAMKLLRSPSPVQQNQEDSSSATDEEAPVIGGLKYPLTQVRRASNSPRSGYSTPSEHGNSPVPAEPTPMANPSNEGTSKKRKSQASMDWDLTFTPAQDDNSSRAGKSTSLPEPPRPPSKQVKNLPANYPQSERYKGGWKGKQKI
ncbi:hypothetical protein CTheo_9077 [Ceratobasidium theobromae]|uniref:Uncharacterized protein n=1 Tax=Ceratobasidium theobromae TaxID=1582974 RepID=A0A5N5Q6W7_9AGAM|nr:hypothetical protein CTheo_9077 [Ceratobasidium theobromae]